MYVSWLILRCDPLFTLVKTFLEKAEIQHMNHGSDFQKLWAQLRDEVAALQAKGYFGDGYWSSGTRLSDSRRVGGEGVEEFGLPEYVVRRILCHKHSISLIVLTSVEALRIVLGPRKTLEGEDKSSSRKRDHQNTRVAKQRRNGNQERVLERKELSKARVKLSMPALAMRTPRPEEPGFGSELEGMCIDSKVKVNCD